VLDRSSEYFDSPRSLRDVVAHAVAMVPERLRHTLKMLAACTPSIVDRSTVVLAVLCEFQAYDTQLRGERLLHELPWPA
jgi:hypothetical protein